MNQKNAIQVEHLTKRYNNAGHQLTVLNDVSFTLQTGSACAIMGPSGSGKTTLLGLCAGLDQADAGTVVIDRLSLSTLSEEERARFRRQSLGFVFQSFRLIPTLTAIENVMVPLELLGEKDIRARAHNMLERVGLKDRMNHFPLQLSGGEQQRVGLARACIHHPKILFADEPTGNLDSETGERIVDLLFELNRTEGITLVLVTHNPELAQKTGRILRLSGGVLVSDETA